MEDEELKAFVARFGLGPEARQALEQLWGDALAQQRSTLVDRSQHTWAGDDDEGDEVGDARALLAEGYDDLGPIATGGMGEVRRVRDLGLRRSMALKQLRAERRASPELVNRFVEEAQVTAQLQHPGVVPVHRLGALADGRPFYTMKEIDGRTLTEVLRELHEAQGEAHWVPSASGWTLRRLLEAVHRVCETIAYAHHRGVLHRDLKPDNIMLGAFGEVWVVDWGLAKVLGEAAVTEEVEAPGLSPVETLGSGLRRTEFGAISGTPAYMAPEQAWGEVGDIGPATDVYGLGAVLYEVLTGHPPYTAPSGFAVLQAVRREALAPIDAGWNGPEHPPEVVALCHRAMARDIAARWPSARAMAGALGAWLDGAKRRETALGIVAQAEALLPEAGRLRARAVALRSAASEALAGVPTWAPAEAKEAAWAKEDEALALERRASQVAVERRQLLGASLTHVADLPEAHAALAETWRAVHADAEAGHDAEALVEAEGLMRAHVDALPIDHPVRKAGAAYLRGDGALTLVTEPPGAEVTLYRYVEQGRRLVPVRERALGPTPLREVPLAMGSYLCRVHHPDRAPLAYPVCIGRQQHWSGVRPGDQGPHPIVLPSLGSHDPGACVVPAGWFQHGHPTSAYALRPGWLWCDAFVMRRFQVTNRDYLAFLDDLVRQGREADALRFAPRERAGAGGEGGALIYGRADDGGFVLRADADGDTWGLDWPVVMVDWPGAMAYAVWEAERTGLPWRLPAELEWEKAARGVDGRTVPWGEHVDPSWCCVRDSHPGRALPQDVTSFPGDISVYGVRGMAGNVADWCLEPYRKEGPHRSAGRVHVSADGASDGRDQRVTRGGNWMSTSVGARGAYRAYSDAHSGVPHLGFRLVRSMA